MIPELTIVKPEVCEEMKKVFEGFNVMINIKNREPQILHRTPIILQCNELPWIRNFAQENSAFNNRIIGYRNLKESRILPKYTDLSPDPRFFQIILREIQETDFDIGMEMWSDDPERKRRLQQTARSAYMEIAMDHINGDFMESVERLGGQMAKTILKTMQEENSNFSRMMARSGERRTITNTEMFEKEVCAYLMYLKQTDAVDYYWNFDDYHKPKLIIVSEPEVYQMLKKIRTGHLAISIMSWTLKK
jgi:hypothetical protein